MWHGILFKEPNPTGSRQSDLIGLCRPTHETPPPNTQGKARRTRKGRQTQPAEESSWEGGRTNRVFESRGKPSTRVCRERERVLFKRIFVVPAMDAAAISFLFICSFCSCVSLKFYHFVFTPPDIVICMREISLSLSLPTSLLPRGLGLSPLLVANNTKTQRDERQKHQCTTRCTERERETMKRYQHCAHQNALAFWCGRQVLLRQIEHIPSREDEVYAAPDKMGLRGLKQGC